VKAAIALTCMVGCTVIANLLLKTGAAMSGTGSIADLVNWRTIAGLATFGMAGILYAIVLRWLPLNVAISFAAVQYVGVLIASSLVLREPIAAAQWFGVVLITSGILVIGWSQR
jgi:drug/metabolite transporter (DMT)-like permease